MAATATHFMSQACTVGLQPLMKCCTDTGRLDVKQKFVAFMKDCLGPMPAWIMQPFISHCIYTNTNQTGLALIQVTCFAFSRL